jgi:hypothetical protein
MKGVSSKSMLTSEPVTADMAIPMPKQRPCSREMLMPTSWAPSGSCIRARTALPMRLRCSTR